MNWKEQLEERWKSASRVFLLYGNIYDLFVVNEATGFLPFFFRNTVMKDSVVLYYDISYGITFGDDLVKTKFFKWLEIYDDAEGTEFKNGKLPKDFNSCLHLAKRFFIHLKTTDKNFNTQFNFVIKYAETVFPSSEGNAISNDQKVAVIRLLSEVGNDLFSEDKFRVILITESISEISKDILNSDYVGRIQIDFPTEQERLDFLKTFKIKVEDYSDLSIERLAKRTSGLNLIKIFHLVDAALSGGTKISDLTIAKEKKRIIEEFCGGLVRFVEPNPKLNLESVGNHEKAKKKLKDIVWMIKSGKESVLEKGILVPGRVGVGKSFLIRCFASECGLPVMELGEFRSKWVGDTEKQLARVLLTIKALGPVVVVVDEADAVFGNREQSGDSGVSSRVFATLAAHIGDSSIRGKEIWIAMTSRPDLLPIDMKRQGRFGLCLPLFAATDKKEVLELFNVIAKSRGIALPESFEKQVGMPDMELTGSEVEAILIRAEEIAVLASRDNQIGIEDLKEAVDSFVDPLDGNLIRKQNLAAILSCSDSRLLPDKINKMNRDDLADTLKEL